MDFKKRMNGEDLLVKFFVLRDIVWMTIMLIIGAIAASYAGFNLFVTRRINRAYYLEEEMRRFHKRFIWVVPFGGPLIIAGFWRKNSEKIKLDTMTKQQRDKQKGDFYESGIGLDS
jgi:hypothetical protein